MYHSVITAGLLKFIPEYGRHIYTPNHIREMIVKWVNDDINFHDGAEQTALDSLEQRQASSGRQLETDQVIEQFGQQQNQQQQPHQPQALEQLRQDIADQAKVNQHRSMPQNGSKA